MPPRTHHTTAEAAEPEAAAGTSPVPGKPLSQVEAEAPPDEETAALWAAEYESRMGAHEAALAAAAAPAAEAEAEAEDAGNPRDWSPSEL